MCLVQFFFFLCFHKASALQGRYAFEIECSVASGAVKSKE